jgi:hypothetical protein
MMIYDRARETNRQVAANQKLEARCHEQRVKATSKQAGPVVSAPVWDCRVEVRQAC